MREIRKYAATSPVIRGRSGGGSEIPRRVGSANARHSGAVFVSTLLSAARADGRRIHVTPALHISEPQCKLAKAVRASDGIGLRFQRAQPFRGGLFCMFVRRPARGAPSAP